MQDYGRAEVEIDAPAVAGSLRTVRYRYTVGHPIDDTGYLKIVFRFAGDFAVPQFDRPEAPDYCAVQTDGDCRIEPRWDPKGHLRPWGKALYLKVAGGYLDRGETVTIIFGDRSHGSPGWRMQTFCEESFEFKTFVDPYAAYRFKELPESPTIAIIAGSPVRAACIAPSQTAVGRSFTVWLRLEDRWGNAVGPAQPFVQPGPEEAGIIRVTVTDPASGLSARSNPVEVRSMPDGMNRYWADFHGQSEETIGSNTIEDYFRFARDCARLDIAAHQGNDFQVTDEFWQKVNDTTAAFNRTCEFITFPGYEWSGNTPLGGDRNVYHRSEGGAIYRSSHELLPDEYSVSPPAPDARTLFDRLVPGESFMFAHVGGRYADTSVHDDSIEVAMEIHSAWGTFEWLAREALGRGYRIGICANSDGHKGRPGASSPGASKFGSYGGLTCVSAPRLARDSVFEALHARRFSATTGHRPLLDVTLSGRDGVSGSMGDILRTQENGLDLSVEYHGTAPVNVVELWRGGSVMARIYPYGEGGPGNRVLVLWSGAGRRGRDRLVVWDGHLKVDGCRILAAVPINFWNADRQPEFQQPDLVKFESVTTGGNAGLLLELDRADGGELTVETRQVSGGYDLGPLGVQPLTAELGGVEMRLAVSRLPELRFAREDVRLERRISLEAPEEAFTVKIVQEDGHITWSSPIFVQRAAV